MLARVGTQQLVRYDAMCSAIDAAYEVDEVKDIRDKAKAIELYERLAHNTEAERRACEIRLRAERKASQLYDAGQKAKGGNPTGANQYAGGNRNRSENCTGSKTLAELGISKREMSDWRKLAAVSDDEFEAALAGPDKPTIHTIIGTPAKAVAPVADSALWLWGTLCDFERMKILPELPADCLSTMTEPMIEDVLRLAPLVAALLITIRGES